MGDDRGESLAGQVAVAWTIRGRVDDGNAKSLWGEWDAGVCQKPYPFRCRNKNDLTAWAMAEPSISIQLLDELFSISGPGSLPIKQP